MRQLISAVLLSFCLWAEADTAIPEMKFRRLDTRDGLSNSQVNTIFQDSRGFVWIGTSYGLNRYDGYRFHTFYSDPNDTTTLRNNYVDLIQEMADGKLLLRQGMNYSIYDPVTETFDRNPQYQLAKLGITSGIDRLHIDSQKNLWVKTYDEGIFCYDPKTKKATRTMYGYEEGMYQKEYYVSSFADYDGKLLIATSNGELIGIDGRQGRVLFVDDHMRKACGRQNEGYTLYVDPQGNYWVMSVGAVYVYAQKEKRWYDGFKDYLLSIGFSDVPDGLEVWDLMLDHHGWLWAATDHSGLLVFDMKSKEYRQFLNSKYDETTLSENTVKHLCQDKAGNMWIGSYRNGLNQYIETLASFKTLEVGDINAVTEDGQGNYWLGSNDKGIIRYNPSTGETDVFNKANSGFTSDIIVADATARDGSVWFGTYNGGLVHYKDGKFTNYLATGDPDGLANNNVWSVTDDRWGNIWIGTLGNGVQKLDMKTGKFRTWSTYNAGLTSDYMSSIGWIKKGWLIAGSSDFYVLINPVNGKVANVQIPPIRGHVAAMGATSYVLEDSRGLIWQGSTAGCCIYEQKSGRQWMLDMNAGLYGSSVVSIAEDLLHTMWVVTEHGISNVVPKMDESGEWTFLVRSFNSRDGLQQGPYNQRSIARTKNGLILVGGLGGVDVINPKLVTNVSNKEKPVFSGLKLFGQQVAVGKAYEGHVILKKALYLMDELVLRPDENQFTIQLATDKGEVHNPSRFIYQLEGFSDKWIRTEENDPNITYMSLHHGDYILHVRMLNDDGTMGETESVLKITVTPPLWRTRWMMLLYILAVVLAAWLWRRRFLRKHEERSELEQIRQEVEKKQWMNEMRQKMKEESQENEPVLEVQTQPEPWVMAPPQKTPGDLQLFMKEQCAQFKAPEGKHLKFTFYPLASDLMVDFDHEQLGQAIQIILNNAVMFSPRDCRIKVFVDKTAVAGTIRISDNGIGLPPGAKEHMFDPVVSDDDSGVCLSVVKDIVTAHGGTVTGDDNPGGGSVYTITLPLEHEEVEEAIMMDEE